MSWLAGELTTLAFLWRIERADGVALGFTSHDRDLVRDGLVHRAQPGMLPSAIERSDGLEAGGVELAGAITSPAITAGDLSSGRWDGARVWLSAVDWRDAGAAPVLLARGTLGTVELAEGRFTARLDGPARALERVLAEVTSPTCRAEFGDRRCRVDLAGRRVLAEVVAVEGAQATLDRAVAGADALLWLDSGRRGRVLTAHGAVLTLAEPGDTGRLEVRQGCDKRFASCRGFGNAANFRGEPHLPGNDLLVRYG